MEVTLTIKANEVIAKVRQLIILGGLVIGLLEATIKIVEYFCPKPVDVPTE